MKKQSGVVGTYLKKSPQLLLPVTTLNVPGELFHPDRSFIHKGGDVAFSAIGSHFRKCFLGCDEERISLPATLNLYELSRPAFDSQITRFFGSGETRVIDIAHFWFFLKKLWTLCSCCNSLSIARGNEYIYIAYVWTPQGYVVAVSAIWHYQCRGIHIAAAVTPDSYNGYEWPQGTQIVSYI